VTRRLTTAVVAATAAALWFGVAAPSRGQRDAARDEFERLRAERERVRSRVVELERRAAVGRTPESGAAAARALRRAFLQATDGVPVGGVYIATNPADRGRMAATGRLAVEGPLDAVLVVTDRLADRDSGVILRHVAIAVPRPGDLEVKLDIDGASARSGP
jgi:hypothetical protein